MPNTFLALLLAFSSLSCAFCAMGGGGMNIASRMTEWRIGGLAKCPYVRKGLMAMWDGEWNAGWGRRTDDAGRWINLVTGEPLELVGSATRGEKYMKPANNSYFRIPLRFAQEIFDTARGGLTLEIVASPDRMNNVGYFAIKKMEGGGSTASDMALSFTTNNLSNGDCATGWLDRLLIYFNHHGCPEYQNYACKFRATLDGTGVAIRWKYGETVKNTSSAGQTSPVTITSGRIGADGAINNGSCKFYSVRIYSRKLSDAELEANEAVDHERFST